MIEYPGRTFGPIESFDDALEKFKELVDNQAPVTALHVGTKYQLLAKKEEKSLADRVSKLENQIKEKEPITTELIILPTQQDINKLNKERV